MGFMIRTVLVCVLVVFAGSGCQHFHIGGGDREAKNRPAVRTVRVAGIVLKWVPADKETNYKRAEPLIREAAAQGADIVMTTECFLNGYAIRNKKIPLDEWRALGEVIPGGEYLTKLQRLSDELDIHLVAGMLERDGDQTHNTAVMIDPDGKLIGKYRKQSLGHEKPRNTPGDASPVFDTAYGKIGLMVCADRREPELIKRLGDNGAELILCPSGGMWGPVKNDHHVQARSRENQVPIVFTHPIEFLVTDVDGEILDRRFAGDQMDVRPGQIDGDEDAQIVAIFDLTVRSKQ